jgi:hypothetical protein
VFRGDVETIVGKALEKDRERRYRTAAELAADVRRYLRDEPIAARPASTFYQLRKFARRNTALVGGVAAVLVVSTIGFAVSTVLFIRAESARGDAEFRAYVANIAAATSSLRAYDVVDARRRLEEVPASLRHREWRHLHNRLDRSRAVIDSGTRSVNCVAFSSDGTRLAFGSADGRVRLVDPARGEVVATTAAHRDVSGGGLAFSPDGRLVASGSLAVKRWDPADGTQVGPDVAAHGEHVHGLAFSPDGTTFATASKDRTACGTADAGP